MPRHHMNSERVRNVKDRLLNIYGEYKCFYCGKLLDRLTVTLDHIIPVSIFRNNKIENIVFACIECNRKRGIQHNQELQKNNHDQSLSINNKNNILNENWIPQWKTIKMLNK
jgi:5-methylcytosine-specific restriction endonuclease McrA